MASHTPAKMPAMHSLEIDTMAATPKITKPMLGGMIGAMMPAEAIRPAERALSCPAATIMGSSSAVSAAASATADPDRAAMMTAAITDAPPPRRRPTGFLATLRDLFRF